MIKLGIIGYPLGHTLSPVMHKAALRHLGIEGNYFVLETPPESLIDRIKQLKIEDFIGFNVTIPLKVWVVPLLNEVDEYANIAGAVNTVIISKNKELYGCNTDIDGFIGAIPEDLRKNLKHKKAVVFGAGGAARAIAVGLSMLNLDEITFYARNLEKAVKLNEIMSASFPDVKIKIKEHNEYADLSYASIIVNTTPIGMQGINEGISPVNKSSVESIQSDAIVYDLVYKPNRTRLLQYAEECNLFTIGGLEMLILQGAKALSLWINQEIPVDIMREAVLKKSS